ncbi:glycoside hydrolase superfamily [Lipomyces kononenkoae]
MKFFTFICMAAALFALLRPVSAFFDNMTIANVTIANKKSNTPIRGVNVGGWLILEQWLGGNIWNAAPNATDEYSLCEILGPDAALSALEEHWSTFFTQETVKELASYGVNALRIPIGYWSVVEDNSQPYVMGAMNYLDQAIHWAKKAGLKVWVDLHGVPGSQNGFDNSGHAGNADWQVYTENINATISVLKSLAHKYSAKNYSSVVVALELINEPISWYPNNVSVTRQFYIDAYAEVRKSLTHNKNLQIIMHDSFVNLSDWSDMPSTVDASYGQLGLDSHIYQVFTPETTDLDAPGHVSTACDYQYTLQNSTDIMPTYAGEWSAAEEICLYSNGTTTAGTSCYEYGCQCTSDDSSNWSPELVSIVRSFVEAQMDVFEGNSTGYFFWSHTGPGAWNFISGVKQGWIPQPLTDRQFPGQCGFVLNNGNHHNTTHHKYHRRVQRGLLGSI